jgi:subtilisin family serine protease
MPDPWHFSELGIGALHARSRGEGIRVAVLDSGIENPSSTFASLRSLTPGGSHAANHDTVGHGTVCGSLIASQNPDAPGIAPRVELISIPVVLGGAAVEGLVRDAFRTALAERCHVISCSFTLPTVEQATQDGMREAANGGAVIVAASGNDPNVFAAFPERTPNVLVVGPHGRNHELLPSRFGLFTDVLAPGVDLPVVTSAGSIATFGETSGATAVVAGIVALVLSAARTLGTARVGLAIEGLAKSTALMSGGARLIDPSRLLHAAQQLP